MWVLRSLKLIFSLGADPDGEHFERIQLAMLCDPVEAEFGLDPCHARSNVSVNLRVRTRFRFIART